MPEWGDETSPHLNLQVYGGLNIIIIQAEGISI